MRDENCCTKVRYNKEVRDFLSLRDRVSFGQIKQVVMGCFVVVVVVSGEFAVKTSNGRTSDSRIVG